MTITETRLFFTSREQQAIRLEGILHHPGGQSVQASGPGNRPAAVVCHPHSLYGGSMDVLLVATIARTLAERGVIALRFNFRGVGRSEGGFGEGRAELHDVAGAVDSLLRAQGVDHERLYLVGYSFGAWVGLCHAEHDPRIRAVAAIGLPMSHAGEGFLSGYARPKLFIAGEDDFVCPPDVLRRFVADLPSPKEVHILRGTDHFFSGWEKEVARVVADFIEGQDHGSERLD